MCSSSQTCVPTSTTDLNEPTTLQQTLLASAIADDLGSIQRMVSSDFTSSAITNSTLEESISFCDEQTCEKNKVGKKIF